MILPQTLAPLPVGPREDDSRSSAFGENDDFVLSNDVYRVLLGTTGGLPVAGLPAEDRDSFAGRSDVRLPARPNRSPFLAVAGDEPVALAPAPLAAIHPVFETMALGRRATPPRVVMDVEREFGSQSRGGDRWWMLGVAVAVAVITLSGTFVDFTSREAVRRAAMEHGKSVAATPVAVPAATPVAEKATPLAASQAVDGVR